jgi:hypothetical protein
MLKPGRYTVEYGVVTEMGRVARRDDVELLSGMRYRTRLDACYGIWTALAPRCWSGRADHQTAWIEEISTGMVVTGDKWCREDPECPGSTCIVSKGKTVGLCDRGELSCERIPVIGSDNYPFDKLGVCRFTNSNESGSVR